MADMNITPRRADVLRAAAAGWLEESRDSAHRRTTWVKEPGKPFTILTGNRAHELERAGLIGPARRRPGLGYYHGLPLRITDAGTRALAAFDAKTSKPSGGSDHHAYQADHH